MTNLADETKTDPTPKLIDLDIRHGSPQEPQTAHKGSITHPDELGRFGNWWVSFFGGKKHSVSLDEIERVLKRSTNPIERRMAFVIRRLSLTCGARFETARRHKKKNRTSLISIIVLSMYAIFFSMTATLNVVIPAAKELLSMYSIFMASFILAFSVYEASKRYDARSESFLRCANEIQKLRDEAATRMMCADIQIGDIEKLETKYHKLLLEYTDNHSLLDYLAHMASIGKIVGPRLIWVRILYLVNIWFMPFLAVASPFILFLMFKIVASYVPLTSSDA
jgi:SMODS and SLOG-associating 2TM effector domain family 5